MLLATAPATPPLARTTAPLATSDNGFAIDQKGLKAGDPAPDFDVSPGKGSVSRNGAQLEPAAARKGNGHNTAPGNGSNVPNGSAERKVVDAKPLSPPSGNKSFFESRSNTAVTDAPASETPEQARTKGKAYKSGAAGNVRSMDSANNAQAVSPGGPAAAEIKSPPSAVSSTSRNAFKD